MKDQLKTIRHAVEAALSDDQPYIEACKKALTALTQIEADHYSAADMASAAAQGFRDGVASVAQQPQKLEDIEQYRMRMAGICTAAIGYWKEGDPIHPDYDTPALRDVAKLYAKYDALYKAQQPQARPDFTDEWTGYLKDGETPFERFLRERKDMQSVLKLYQRVLEENERLKAQQPQAEPDAYCITTPDGGCISTDPRCIHQPQAEAVSDDLRDRLVAIGAAIADQDDRAAQAMIREILAAPQQAEAVPPSNLIDPGSVVSFAVDRWLAEVANRPLVNVHRRTLDDTWRQVIRRFGGDPVALLGPPHDELAAIAQQKGHP